MNTYKEERAYVERIIARYKRDLVELDYFKEYNYYPKLRLDMVRDGGDSRADALHRNMDKVGVLTRRVAMIEGAGRVIGEEFYNIIVHDFVKRDVKWWMSEYPRSTYYRRRRLAVSAFARYAQDILEIQE